MTSINVGTLETDHHEGDLTVVNAARVSFSKAHDEFDPAKDVGLINYLAKHDHWSPFAHAQICFKTTLSPETLIAWAFVQPMGLRVGPRGDGHLVSGSIYAFLRNAALFKPCVRDDILWTIKEHYPTSFAALSIHPAGEAYAGFATLLSTHDLFELALDIDREDADDIFRHITQTVHVKAPIFLARQLVKHQEELVWNEISRRYVDKAPEFYHFDEWRGRAADKKQGSTDEVLTEFFFNWGNGDPASPVSIENFYDLHGDAARHLYDALLEGGVCPEQARVVLPLSMMTEWYWTGTLKAFARVYKQRSHPHAQKEAQEFADVLDDQMLSEWGEIWELAKEAGS
jgi:thymidylate synthase (FAD)